MIITAIRDRAPDGAIPPDCPVGLDLAYDRSIFSKKVSTITTSKLQNHIRGFYPVKKEFDFSFKVAIYPGRRSWYRRRVIIE